MLNNKKYIKLIHVRRGFPLGLNERLVYSALVFRSRHDRGFSQRVMAAWTGLSKNFIHQYLDRLCQYQLCEKRGRFWYALEPQGDVRHHFVFLGSGKRRWQERFAYIRYYVPSQDCPLTPRENALYGLLRTEIVRNRWSISRLATLLGVSRDTVRRALTKLRRLKLITRTAGDQLTLEELDEHTLAYWADKPQRQAGVKVVQHETDNWTEERKREYIAGAGSKVGRRFHMAYALEKYSIDEYNDILEIVRDLMGRRGVTEDMVVRAYDQALRENAYGTNSYRLWKYKLTQVGQRATG